MTTSKNAACSSSATGPRRLLADLPMIDPADGVSSAAVPVRKISSVMEIVVVGRLDDLEAARSRAISMTDSRVMPSRML
ncbi:MAG: hypothetical protein R3F21_14130 [Myxococcota bacterium]